MQVSTSISKNPRKKSIDRSRFSITNATCGINGTCSFISAQSRIEPKNIKSMTGETSDRASWNTKIFGSAIQHNVPDTGRSNVSRSLQNDCSTANVQAQHGRT